MKPKVTTTVLIAIGLAIGFAGARLYFHDLWGTTGFVWAACACVVVFTQARFIEALIRANHTIGRSMSELLNTLQEAGIEITQVSADGDVETHTTTLTRKGAH